MVYYAINIILSIYIEISIFSRFQMLFSGALLNNINLNINTKFKNYQINKFHLNLLYRNFLMTQWL